MKLYVYFFYFHILSLLVFTHDFIRCVDFTHIAASNTASRKLGHTQILIQT